MRPELVGAPLWVKHHWLQGRMAEFLPTLLWPPPWGGTRLTLHYPIAEAL